MEPRKHNQSGDPMKEYRNMLVAGNLRSERSHHQAWRIEGSIAHREGRMHWRGRAGSRITHFFFTFSSFPVNTSRGFSSTPFSQG